MNAIIYNLIGNINLIGGYECLIKIMFCFSLDESLMFLSISSHTLIVCSYMELSAKFIFWICIIFGFTLMIQEYEK